MGLYGLKDLNDVVFIDKATGLPALTMSYANTANLDITADQINATIRGANVITWDSDKNATLTLESEVFEIGYLAMALGADVKEGEDEIFQRVEGVVNNTRQVNIGEGNKIRPETISVVRLEKPGSVTHAGLPLYNSSAALLNLPAQVTGIVISANDTTAKIKFDATAGANEYVITRNDVVVAETASTEYEDVGLEADTTYLYKIEALNEFGKGAASALVSVETAADGTLTYSEFRADQQAIEEARNNVGSPTSPAAGVSYTFENGIIRFSEDARIGDAYAIYFMEETANVTKLEIDADRFAGSYEIFANGLARLSETGQDELLQFRFFNARPQANLALNLTSEAPMTLSLTLDLMATQHNGRQSALFDTKIVH